MIRLTDEEIERYRLKWASDFKPNANYVMARDIAKAQLKKVVEWLKSRNSSPSTALLLHIKEWQALLEEVNGHTDN